MIMIFDDIHHCKMVPFCFWIGKSCRIYCFSCYETKKKLESITTATAIVDVAVEPSCDPSSVCSPQCRIVLSTKLSLSHDREHQWTCAFSLQAPR